MMQTTGFDDYWQREEHVARLMLPLGDYESEVFFLWHASRESYGTDHREIGVNLKGAGERDYVHAKACYYSPRIIVTFDLAPPAQTQLGEEIGQVTDSRVEGSDRHFIAGLQGWYYLSEKTLMLWEVDLFGQYRTQDPTRDFLLGAFWYFFEQGLLQQFSDCERIVTPGWEPKYEGEKWRQFLESRGYVPHEENTFIKSLSVNPPGAKL